MSTRQNLLHKRGAFRRSIRKLGNPYLEEFLKEEGVRNWREARVWLRARTADIIRQNLGPMPLHAAERLLDLRVELGLEPFDPRGFRGLKLPLPIVADCALRYGSLEQFRVLALAGCRSPYFRRDDLYVAWKLGLLTDAEFEAAPPQVGDSAYRYQRFSPSRYRTE